MVEKEEGWKEAVCVTHAVGGAWSLFSPGVAEPANPTRRKGSGMEASNNNLFLFFFVWVFQGSACEITKSYCMF